MDLKKTIFSLLSFNVWTLTVDEPNHASQRLDSLCLKKSRLWKKVLGACTTWLEVPILVSCWVIKIGIRI
jgi:hypothetical protein